MDSPPQRAERPTAPKVPELMSGLLDLVDFVLANEKAEAGKDESSPDPGSSSASDMNYNKFSLMFEDRRLEILFYDYLCSSLSTTGPGAPDATFTWKDHLCSLTAGVRYKFIVFLVLIIFTGLLSPSIVKVPTGSFAIDVTQAICWACFMGLSLVAIILYRLTKPCRIVSWEADTVPSVDTLIARTATLQRFMHAVFIATCCLVALWLACFMVIERALAYPLVVAVLCRYAVPFAVFDHFPIRFWEKTLVVVVAVLVYHITALIEMAGLSTQSYAPPMSTEDEYDQSLGRAVSITVVTAVTVFVIGCLAYQRELAQRRAFYRCVLAAAIQREYRELRATANALLDAQLPSFLLGNANISTMRQTREVSNTQAVAADQVVITMQESTSAGRTQINADAFQTFTTAVIIKMHYSGRLDDHIDVLNSSIGHLDELCALYGVDKIQVRNDVWVGAAGLSRNMLETGGSIQFAAAGALRFAVAAFEELASVPLLRCCVALASDRTVAGALSSSRFEYQIFGGGVSDAFMLAVLLRDGILVAESTVQLLTPDCMPTGYTLKSKAAMPSSAMMHGHGSSYYKQLVRIPPASNTAAAELPKIATTAPRPSKWAQHKLPAASLSREAPPKSFKELELWASAARANLSLDNARDASVNTHATRASTERSGIGTRQQKKSDSSSSFTHVERFLISRGILRLESSDPTTNSTDSQDHHVPANRNTNPLNISPVSDLRLPQSGNDVHSLGSPHKISFSDCFMGGANIERAFVQAFTVPAATLFPAFIFSALAIEVCADADIFASFLPFTISKVIFAYLAVLIACGVLRLLAPRSIGRWLFIESITVVCCWLVFLALDCDRVAGLEAIQTCGRYARTTMWAVATGIAYVVVLTPLPTGIVAATGIIMCVTWIAVVSVAASSSNIVSEGTCPPPHAVWSRCGLIAILTLYFILCRAHQDKQLQSVFRLKRKMKSAQSRAKKQAAKIIDAFVEIFSVTTLAIALNSRATILENQLVGTPQAILDKYLGPKPAHRSWGAPIADPNPTASTGDVIKLFERYEKVAVLCIDLSTVRRLSGMLGPEDTMAIMSSLGTLLDKACTSNEGTRVGLLGTCYTAVFGPPVALHRALVEDFRANISQGIPTTPSTHPDGQETMDSSFAHCISAINDCMQSLRGLAGRYGVQLHMTAAISTGDIVVGALGARNLQYQAVGLPVSRAEKLASKYGEKNLLVLDSTAKEDMTALGIYSQLLCDLKQKDDGGEAHYLVPWNDSYANRGNIEPKASSLPSPPLLDELQDGENGEITSSDFKLLAPLGSGHFATVFLAVHRPTSNPFAVKVLQSKSTRSKSLQAELRALSAPNPHPCVVEFICALDAPNGEIWLVQEYIEGCTLEALLVSAGKLSERRVRLLLAELVCGIGHLHSLGIIHRDVKPANILISRQGHIKLIDLGLAALVSVDRGFKAAGLGSFARSESLKTDSAKGDRTSLPSNEAGSSATNTPSDGTHSGHSSREDSKEKNALMPVSPPTNREASQGSAGVVALLQNLAPMPHGKVFQRLRRPRTSSMSGVIGTALLIDLFQDPLHSNQSIYEALRLYGLWVMEANNVKDAVASIVEYGSRVIDVVVLTLRSARDVDAAIKWRYDSSISAILAVIPLCALLPSSQGHAEHAKHKLERAGFGLVGTSPASASFLDEVQKLASTHSGLTKPIDAEPAASARDVSKGDELQAGLSSTSPVDSVSSAVAPVILPMDPAQRQPSSSLHPFASVVTANALQNTVSSVAGTPFAMAPETQDRKTGLVADWFSVGVTAFRCLTGEYPFAGETRKAVQMNIKANAVQWHLVPPTLVDSTVDLLRRLLEPDPAVRLGAHGDATEVLGHAFFEEIQPWDMSCSELKHSLFSAQEQLSVLTSLREHAALKLSADWLQRSVSREASKQRSSASGSFHLPLDAGLLNHGKRLAFPQESNAALESVPESSESSLSSSEESDTE